MMKKPAAPVPKKQRGITMVSRAGGRVVIETPEMKESGDADKASSNSGKD